jgi:hypothetical protein
MLGQTKQAGVLLGVVVAVSSWGFAQQPQTSTTPLETTSPNGHATWTQGVGPGYWPTSGGGQTLNIAAGTALCGAPPVYKSYAGSTLTMTASFTNYVYLDPTDANCAPHANLTGFAYGQIPIGIVTMSGSNIASVNDVRTWFQPNPCGVDSSGAVTCQALASGQNFTLTPGATGGNTVLSSGNLSLTSGNVTLPGGATLSGSSGSASLTLTPNGTGLTIFNYNSAPGGELQPCGSATGSPSTAPCLSPKSILQTIYPSPDQPTTWPLGSDLVLLTHAGMDEYLQHTKLATTSTTSVTANTVTDVSLSTVTDSYVNNGGTTETFASGDSSLLGTQNQLTIARGTTNEDRLPYNQYCSVTGTVSTDGTDTTVTFVSGTQFTTGTAWNGLTIFIAGTAYTISSVSSATSLTVTATPPANSGAMYFIAAAGATNAYCWTPFTGTVSTSGSTVTWDSGPQFTTGGTWNGASIIIAGTQYTISSVSSGTQLTLTSSPPTLSGANYYTPTHVDVHSQLGHNGTYDVEEIGPLVISQGGIFFTGNTPANAGFYPCVKIFGAGGLSPNGQGWQNNVLGCWPVRSPHDQGAPNDDWQFATPISGMVNASSNVNGNLTLASATSSGVVAISNHSGSSTLWDLTDTGTESLWGNEVIRPQSTNLGIRLDGTTSGPINPELILYDDTGATNEGLVGLAETNGGIVSGTTKFDTVLHAINGSLQIATNSTIRATVTNAGNVGIGTTSPQATLDTAGQDRRKPVNFSTLTACGSTIEGETAAVKDSTTATWGATITGNGGNHVLAYCDGTNWTVAAK